MVLNDTAKATYFMNEEVKENGRIIPQTADKMQRLINYEWNIKLIASYFNNRSIGLIF